jgi:molybdenum cofactor cytidylyltransferase
MDRTERPRPDTATVAAIVLAAGTSSRMGTHKLLLPLGDRPIIAHTVEAVVGRAVSPIVVVLGRDAALLAPHLPAQGITIVINPDFASGMASSLRVGVNALPRTPVGTIVLLGDQPLVTPDLIDGILAEAAKHPEAIVSANVAGKRGHPVYFPRNLFDALTAVTGDEGGRSVIAQHEESLRLLDWPEVSTGLDVDTTAEYELLRSIWSAQIEGEPR